MTRQFNPTLAHATALNWLKVVVIYTILIGTEVAIFYVPFNAFLGVFPIAPYGVHFDKALFTSLGVVLIPSAIIAYLLKPWTRMLVFFNSSPLPRLKAITKFILGIWLLISGLAGYLNAQFVISMWQESDPLPFVVVVVLTTLLTLLSPILLFSSGVFGGMILIMSKAFRIKRRKCKLEKKKAKITSQMVGDIEKQRELEAACQRIHELEIESAIFTDLSHSPGTLKSVLEGLIKEEGKDEDSNNSNTKENTK